MFPSFPFDVTLFFAINHLPHSSLLDSLAMIVHYITYSGYLFMGWFIFNVLTQDISRKELGKLQLIALVLVSGIEFVLKHLFQRLRPYQVLTNVFYVKPGPVDFAFPSGQAAIAFAAATIYVLLFPSKPETPFFVTLAFITLLDRVYMGHHYPLDVFAGALLGISCGVVVQRLYWLKRKDRQMRMVSDYPR